MTLLNRRCKTISIRLSPVEFRLVQAACAKNGARSVSDFARAAIQRALGEGTSTSGDDLNDLRAKVDFLSEELGRLTSPVRRAAGDA